MVFFRRHIWMMNIKISVVLLCVKPDEITTSGSPIRREKKQRNVISIVIIGRV